MKKFILLLIISVSLASTGFSQMRSCSTKDLIETILKYDLSKVKDVTDDQFKKLVAIDEKLNKEHPYADGNFGSRKVRYERLMKVYALREKLYPQVLNAEQMKQYLKVLKLYRKILNDPNYTPDKYEKYEKEVYEEEE